jgi:hypothetical protein
MKHPRLSAVLGLLSLACVGSITLLICCLDESAIKIGSSLLTSNEFRWFDPSFRSPRFGGLTLRSSLLSVLLNFANLGKKLRLRQGELQNIRLSDNLIL